jgi:hypothetical protein
LNLEPLFARGRRDRKELAGKMDGRKGRRREREERGMVEGKVLAPC